MNVVKLSTYRIGNVQGYAPHSLDVYHPAADVIKVEVDHQQIRATLADLALLSAFNNPSARHSMNDAAMFAYVYGRHTRRFRQLPDLSRKRHWIPYPLEYRENDLAHMQPGTIMFMSDHLRGNPMWHDFHMGVVMSNHPTNPVIMSKIGRAGPAMLTHFNHLRDIYPTTRIGQLARFIRIPRL